MKTNFKKLALMAGVSAAMAAGSMSAHAVIQAVPAPAVLIPLFSTVGTTTVRIEVPSSVGLDSVVNLYGGPNTLPGGGIASSNVAVGLSASAPSSSTPVTSKLHWFFMDNESNEMANASFPVSANDVIEFDGNTMPAGFTGSTANTVDLDAANNNTNGYLVIINESAYLGGAPAFSFQADAFWNPGTINSVVFPINNIPVIPLTDAADNGAAAPSLTNNVLEDVSGVPSGAAYGGGPIVSPLVSGIRLGVANASGAAENWFRAIDFQINGANGSEQYVVWNDRNASANVVNGAIVTTPGVSGTMLSYDCNENAVSIPALSLENQLNFVSFGANTYLGAVANSLYPVGYSDPYAGLGLGNTQGGTVGNGTCATAAQGGFIRWFAQSNPYNYGGQTNAAYQSMVIFRLRQDADDGYSQFPVDRGFFTAK